MPTAIFRCDASTTIGSGHIMRCLTLANYMKELGWTCIFSTFPETLKAAPALVNSGYEVIAPNALKHCDVMVVDHYELSAPDETAFRASAKKIIVIDDLADRSHDCDVLLDQTYGRVANDYKDLTPKNAAILTGSEYALLRPEFQKLRPTSLKRRDLSQGKIERVLIAILQTNLNLTVDVVIGGGNPHLESLRQQIKSMGPDIHLHVNVSNMAALMVQADLAIGAGGTTSWERACLGLPTLLIEIAGNQKTISANLHAQGVVINLGWHENITTSNIADALRDLRQSQKLVLKMSQRARELCSGDGASHLAPFFNHLLA